MNAIEIRNLCKTFKDKQALQGLDMTVPKGAIYGFIGENGSGKSTTEKILCGLVHPTSGSVLINGCDMNDETQRSKIGVLIESPGCYPNYSVWNNLMLQAINLDIQNKEDEIRRLLKLVRMEGAASNKYKNCSLGMRQRIGIALALMGNPEILVLDEPINGLDADGMRIMREVLTDLAKSGITVLISSHILSELEKIATHYGIIRQGKMIKEMTCEEFEQDCPSYISLKTLEYQKALKILSYEYKRVEVSEDDTIRVYDNVDVNDVVNFLYKNDILVSNVETAKISLEEYYVNLIK